MKLFFSSVLLVLFFLGIVNAQNVDSGKVLGEKSDTLQNAWFLNRLQSQFPSQWAMCLFITIINLQGKEIAEIREHPKNLDGIMCFHRPIRFSLSDSDLATPNLSIRTCRYPKKNLG